MNNYLVSPTGYAISLLSGASLGLSIVLIQDKILNLYNYRTETKVPSRYDIISSVVGFGMLTSGLYLLLPISFKNLWLR